MSGLEYIRGDRQFTFDHVFGEQCNNQLVFRYAISPLIQRLVNGYNSTCFAYGMTGTIYIYIYIYICNVGAGKTHTMLGDIYSPRNEEKGICLLSVDSIFEELRTTGEEFRVEVSYLEIYNEMVRDLLRERSGDALMIVEDPHRGVIVPDLYEYEVKCTKELKELIIQGNGRRTMAPTAVNQFSSRSHAILQINIQRDVVNIEESGGESLVNQPKIMYAKFSVIDLAGSERGATCENRGQRMVEGGKINKSLLALGNCINILSDKGKSGCFVPYRDSKLTRLLKDSLGGNTHTVMIGCVSPAGMAYEETINTLKYAERAKRIKKKVSQCVKEVDLHADQYKEIIKTLKGEIEVLKHTISSRVDFSIDPKYTITQNDFDELQQFRKAGTGSNAHTKSAGGDINHISKNKESSNLNMESTPNLQPERDITKLNEIENELKCFEEEKNKLQVELNSNKKRVRESIQISKVFEKDDFYVQQISQNLLSNFEENWEIKQSIAELDELRTQNTKQVLSNIDIYIYIYNIDK